ncbi:MAG: ABC transporter ATP-binding protein [Pseudomonadota bacterium]
MNSTPLVCIENLSKVYTQGTEGVHALQDINLTIQRGEFAALVGPSGSGKTTLLNLIGALDKPSTGKLLMDQENYASQTRTSLAAVRLHKIGFVFQDYSLLPVLTALENVEYVLLLQGVPASERRARADAALQQLGLDGCQHRRPSQLSGGQQQRVAVARAMVGNPLLVLADEPTANLDSATGEDLLVTMLDLNRSQGTTFIFSTHDPMVMQHAQHVVRLKDGKVVEDSAHANR